MDNSSAKFHCVFVETDIETRLGILVDDKDTVSTFKEKLCNDHSQCFPEVGEITISTLKVERDGTFYHLPDSTNLSKVFEGYGGEDWSIYVDTNVVLHETNKPVNTMTSLSNLDVVLLEKNAKFTNLEEEGASLKTEVLEVEKRKTKKRKKKSSGKKSKKKVNVEVVEQSKIVKASESSEKDGVSSDKVKVEYAADSEIVKDSQSSEKDGVSIGEDKQTNEVEMLAHEESLERVTIGGVISRCL